MRSSVVFVFALLAATPCGASPQANATEIAGTWRGIATFRDAPLEFRIRFIRDGESIRATFSSPDLLLLDQPLDSVRLTGSRIAFSTRDDYPIRFQGIIAGDVIRGGAGVPAVPGVVSRGPGIDTTQLRFILTRITVAETASYATRNVRFDDSTVRLAGTVFVPASSRKRVPGVVLLQGSSANLRSDYLFYADHFARAGYAVLTFDKRGNGESTGDYGVATYDDLAEDAAAAVRFLRRQPSIDTSRVGVWGLSQGAFIEPLVSTRVPLSFLIAVSPPGVNIGESAAYQDSLRLVSTGFTASVAGRAARLDRSIERWLRTRESGAVLDHSLRHVANERWRRASSIPTTMPSGPSLEGWYWRGRTVDPIPLWQSVRPPVLVVFGAADELVPAPVSESRIRQALRNGGNRDATLRVFPAANHVLRQLPLVAGGRWDWPKAAPGYLDLVDEWIAARVR